MDLQAESLHTSKTENLGLTNSSRCLENETDIGQDRMNMNCDEMAEEANEFQRRRKLIIETARRQSIEMENSCFCIPITTLQQPVQPMEEDYPCTTIASSSAIQQDESSSIENYAPEDIKLLRITEGDESHESTTTSEEIKKPNSIFGFRNAFATLRRASLRKRKTVQRSQTNAKSQPIVVHNSRTSLPICPANESNENKKLSTNESTQPILESILPAIQPILDEFIETEKAYVESLCGGLNNYSDIFERLDLPQELRGKEFELLGNIEQIKELHRSHILPMLETNRLNGEQIFNELLQLIKDNQFHIYVIYTINKRRGMDLVGKHKTYFQKLGKEFGDRLGIGSFLLKPIQRLARYPLLITQCISTLFKTQNSQTKALLTTCCRLETKLRNFLTTINESECVNDIEDCEDIENILTTFRRVGKFEVHDYGRWRSYNGKVFLFDNCLIVTKIVEKILHFKRKYYCDTVKIGIIDNGFTLYTGPRYENKCNFLATNAEQVEIWVKMLHEVITTDRSGASDIESMGTLDDKSEQYIPIGYQKVSEFRIFDHTMNRKYLARVFLFPECITYAESKRERLILRGTYPFDHLGISPTDESFTLFYDRRHQQECDFMGKPKLIKVWMNLIHEQISQHFRMKMMRLAENSKELEHILEANDEMEQEHII
uniref:DH domain-containing protein n=1 Tax=Stomoxys calcitrans TaxID=35570 RepID=A0A1I8PF37_STOCA